jgi:hypothetical protein
MIPSRREPCRRSLGGSAVERSLVDSGFVKSQGSIALVETEFPRRHGFETVVAQNACNVIPASDFRALASQYPRKMRAA